jgi:DNA-directed RNA polymerase subunit RPC12/RpoP
MNNNKRSKRCIDCGNELFPESYEHEVVVCEDCLLRIKRQFWASVNIEMTDKKTWMKKKEDE